MVTELPRPDAPGPGPRFRIVGPAEAPRDEDVALIEAIAAREAAALGLLYDRHADALFAMLFRIVGDREAAEELLQEAFLRAWQQARQFDPSRGVVRHWLQRIAHNLALNELRRRRRRPQVARAALDAESDLESCVDPEPEPAEIAWRTVRDAGLVAALDRLPPGQRVVIELYAAGFSQTEIATKLSEPLGTVKSRMRRGLLELRQALPAVGIDAGSTID